MMTSAKKMNTGGMGMQMNNTNMQMGNIAPIDPSMISSQPCTTILVLDIPLNCTEKDLSNILSRYGVVLDVQKISDGKNAMVEFSDMSVASQLVQMGRNNPFFVGQNRAQLEFSSQRINRNLPQMEQLAPISDNGETRILHFEIANAQYPITTEVLNTICSPHGKVQRICVGKKSLDNSIESLIEFETIAEAKVAKENLHGADIYSGCCTLNISFSKLNRVHVVKNDSESWDYTTSNPGKEGLLGSQPSANKTLLDNNSIPMGNTGVGSQMSSANMAQGSMSNTSNPGTMGNTNGNAGSMAQGMGGLGGMNNVGGPGGMNNMGGPGGMNNMSGSGGMNNMGGSGTGGMGNMGGPNNMGMMGGSGMGNMNGPNMGNMGGPGMGNMGGPGMNNMGGPGIGNMGGPGMGNMGGPGMGNMGGPGMGNMGGPGMGNMGGPGMGNMGGPGMGNMGGPGMGNMGGPGMGNMGGPGMGNMGGQGMGNMGGPGMNNMGGSGMANMGGPGMGNMGGPGMGNMGGPGMGNMGGPGMGNMGGPGMGNMGGPGGMGFGNQKGNDYFSMRPPPGQGMSPAMLAKQQKNNKANTFLPKGADVTAVFESGEGTVIMCYNMSERLNCDNIFNLFCLYGNVARVKFLKSRQGCAMVQMGNKLAADNVLKHYDGAVIFGKQIQVCQSKQSEVQDNPNPGNLDDGTPLIKNYMKDANNRFRNDFVASKSRILEPGRTLHFFNGPPTLQVDEIKKVYIANGIKPPVKACVFPIKPGQKTSIGLLEWDTVEEALEAMACSNHIEINVDNADHPFHLKLAFSPRPIKDENDGISNDKSSNGKQNLKRKLQQ